MELYLLIVAIISTAALSEATCSTSCLITLPCGKIQGKCDDGMCVYTNIPYALSPTGTRRLEPPVPYNGSWTGIRDATQDIVSCIQFSVKWAISTNKEDCLFVNVYVPSSSKSVKYPVRAYIHGGAFMFGSPNQYNPVVIVKSGMVVVTIAYRLGPLGFLSTGDNRLSANNGLKDQREALRWIQKYISYFSGNPNKVLLSGWSAGGGSVHLHALRKEKLFNAAMANNGVALDPWAFQPNAYEQYSKFIGHLNCPSTYATVKKCIRSKSVEELQSATEAMKVFGDNPCNVFGAVVENANVVDAFITAQPEDIIKAGNASAAPLLIAYTEREGSYNAADFMAYGADGEETIKILNEKYLEYLPLMLFYNNTLPAALLDLHTMTLKNQYLGSKPFSVENYRLLENMFTDVMFHDGIKKAICLHRKYSPGKLYVYEYKYPHTLSIGNFLAGRTDITFGADHGADAIFTIPMLPFTPATLTANEQNIRERLCDLYKSLANGRPIYDDIKLPLNTPERSAKLTINQYSHDIEVNYCNDGSCSDCAGVE